MCAKAISLGNARFFTSKERYPGRGIHSSVGLMVAKKMRDKIRKEQTAKVLAFIAKSRKERKIFLTRNEFWRACANSNQFKASTVQILVTENKINISDLVTRPLYRRKKA